MDCHRLFAYGTLKSDQLRGSMWPRRPLRIEPAITTGELWDLGSYPGLSGGSGWILGEVWTFNLEDIEPTLEVLDGIEGYDARRDCGLYLRRQIEVRILDGSAKPKAGLSSPIKSSPEKSPLFNSPAVKSYVYITPDPSRWPKARRIQPWYHDHWEETLASWPDSQSHVPKDLSQED